MVGVFYNMSLCICFHSALRVLLAISKSYSKRKFFVLAMRNVSYSIVIVSSTGLPRDILSALLAHEQESTAVGHFLYF